jgi:putative hydroxymethylpyrimidine transport system permease protein
MRLLRPLVVGCGLLAAWQALVWLTQVPWFILPGPDRVLGAWLDERQRLLENAVVTIAEILLGLALGTLLGALAAIAVAHWRGARLWLLPVLVASQAVPVFALAPLLVLWLGYGMASKVAMATLIIFFPVTASFLDGLRRTEPGWLDLARTMTAGRRRARWAELRHVRIPAALPALASGLRVAAATAPIGAVVGEWVGASAGLGYLMMHALARVQTSLAFAALFTLALIGAALYFAIDAGLRRLIPWQHEALADERAS